MESINCGHEGSKTRMGRNTIKVTSGNKEKGREREREREREGEREKKKRKSRRGLLDQVICTHKDNERVQMKGKRLWRENKSRQCGAEVCVEKERNERERERKGERERERERE